MTRSVKLLLFVGDLLLLNLSVFLALIFSDHWSFADKETKSIYLFLFTNLTWLYLSMLSNPYNMTKGWTVSKVIKSQLAFLLIHLMVVASLKIFFRQNYSLTLILLMYATFIPLFFLFRVATFYVRKVFTAEVSAKNFILLGQNMLAADVRKYFLMNPELKYNFQGYIDFDPENFSIDKIQQICAERQVHEVYCCAPNVTDEQLHQLISFGLNSLIKVKVVTASIGETINLERFDNLPVRDHATIALDDGRNQVIKRLFDFAFSVLFVTLVLSWLIPLIGLIIKLDSKGPVFFIQKRSGKDNQPFNCLKFRTMVVNSDSDSKQASREDNRITKFGHFLRKTSIDELPQFINVLIGTMSVVGPRPHMLRHTDEYSKVIEQFMGRHYVKPGITGLAQCLGYRGETKDLIDMENRVRMDRYYIENWTFWFDIKIIFLTIISLIRGSDKAF
jgi:putative colanic acid biosynthesis UDP-glucose lipid carrier transferase